MKVLDVSSLHDGIKRMSRQLSELEKQLNHVESGIRSFVASKDSFRGKGASAIRRFYEYAHLPFLQFFQTFLANFQSKFHQLQLELDGLEGNSRGFIDEGFLTSELEDGLNQLSRMVTELTGDANAQLSRVSDIVYLPRLQDHQFHEGIQQAKQSANQTVDKLHQFDHQQTQSFTALIEDLSLLQNYIEEMSQQFASGKMKLTSFSPVMLQDLEAYGKLETKLYNQTVMQRWNSEHFPELGVFFSIGHAASFDQWANPSCAKPEPKKKTAGEAFWDFTNGFGSGIISAASDTWDGIKRLATEPDQVLKETIEFLDAVVSEPAILLEIGHELYNSFNESVIHGDATSRGEWLGYATAIIGTSVVGDKGLSKVGGIAGKLGTKVETDLNIKLKDQQEKVLSSVKGSSAAGLERVRELMDGMFLNNQWGMAFAGVPSNVMNSVGIYDKVNDLKKHTLNRIENIAGKVLGDANNVIRTYRNADISKLEKKYMADPRITVEMPYVGKNKSGTNSEGWLRDKDYYWKEIINKHPESLSEMNIQKINLGFSPINDKIFREHFPQYDIKELYNDTLIHHHIGGGGQAVAVPSRLHPGTGGIHNAEKASGVWGSDRKYAELLEKFLKK
ncbi:T7SS effector LXG polymorphic toxin [Sutcliffiella horikoshii]|uniref:T7SS effector LXG polymorphic toxin n=1 Tax=Sutcliffiella horikoshii TaxID=79883 RepID=UPI003CE7ECFF